MDKSAHPMNVFNPPRLFRLTAILLALAGCAQLPQNSGKSDGHASVTDTYLPRSVFRNMLVFSQDFPKLSLEAQRKELTKLNQTTAYNAQSKLMLAMAYGLPNSHVRDSAKALALLDEVAAEKRLDEESLMLAVIMRDYISEMNKSAQKTRDEQKRADASQQKLDELQKKLDDLKNIEKTMVDRDQGVRK
jgi:hypothetical protein